MYENLLILSLFAYLYSMFAGRLERTPVNGALVFTAFGVIFGPLGLGLLDLNVENETMRSIAELTLAMVLFSDAAKADLAVLKRSIELPQRLLLIGLPLTILLGFAVGYLVFDTLTLIEIAILATMLAPTDAALGKAVVSDKSVPEAIRESLNVESGLNDGICVPILFVFLALATGVSGDTSTLAIKLVAEEIGIGVFAGLVLASSGSWLLRLAGDRGWLTESWEQLPVVMLAVACFTLAQVLGGSGFIAAFVGGLLFGALTKRRKHQLLLSAESTGDIFAMITWIIFGAGVIVDIIDELSWQVLVYAVLSLTVIRIVPVLLSLLRTELSVGERLFMGWFGPRGLASIVFAVIVFVEDLPGGYTLAATVVLTVVLSIIAHGLSANPLVARIGRAAKSQGTG